ncbi:hypothetical protein [Paenibacillus abyssi]|uniref:Uncharacterized protein n=1 Tax=Paenibacillus abyssi TaxID=1340531 RepID=A0A917G5A2_9BACL|nr:hypothetical protein [Paenibacillus abyssi]GGG23296.1 hypothetical protein GCM10010916_44860 [Paenibacillus abyssi]
MADREGSSRKDWFMFHFSSVKVLGEQSLVAAPMGQGVLRKDKAEDWESINNGLPGGTHVNRLYADQDQLTACTNQGLFHLHNDVWEASGLVIGCYQYKQVGRMGIAATQYGLWSGLGGNWSQTAYPNSIVYDVLYLPQFIVLALDRGIAVYDRLTGAWMEYSLGSAVISLAAYNGIVLGVTERGELLQGNKRGGFDKINFAGMFIFSIVTKGSNVFVCSDRGLYRLSTIHNQITLLSVKLGCPVTDMDSDGSSLYLATLFEGVQMIGQ